MPYAVTPTCIPDVLILETKVFGDSRGFFLESFNQQDFKQATGLNEEFVQDNHSRSAQGVLRGLHYQLQQPQGKLVRVVRSAVFDVAVDIRKSSPTFCQWAGVELAENNNKQFWEIPDSDHSCMVASETVDFLNKSSENSEIIQERYRASNKPVQDITWRTGLMDRYADRIPSSIDFEMGEVFA
jgi:dTDP-4-dehydrorhamnose 3,5-epimerase